MIFRILLFAAIVYLIVKIAERTRAFPKPKRKKRVVYSELDQLRARFNRISDHFHPHRERKRLASALHQLINAGGRATRTEAYQKGLEAVRNIIGSRESDVRLIVNLPALRERYEESGLMFTDQLRTRIEEAFRETDSLSAHPDPSQGIDDLRRLARLLTWLIEMGEAGRDNSIHWKQEYQLHLEELQKDLADEQSWWAAI